MSKPVLGKKSAAPKALPPGALDLVAARFRMLGEPMRLRLLNELRSGEKTVTQLVEAAAAGQANVSKHLGLLAEGGLVGRRKDGLNVFYFIADESLFELCDIVCGRLQKELAEKSAHFGG
jgi:ArsR family transcriptional regulator